MVDSAFASALTVIFGHEGGYSQHPKDPGGATKYGITLKVLGEWRGRRVAPIDVKALTRQEASEIYHARYWQRAACDQWPAGLDLLVFDAAVNSGVSRALHWMQRAALLPADGLLHEAHIAAIRASDPHQLIDRYSDIRLNFLRSLHTWPIFGRGWSRRVEDIRQRTHALVPAKTAPASRNRSLS